MKFIDLTGKIFNKLTVLKRVSSQNKHTRWLCRCECGNEIVAKGINLKNNHTKSCGCLKNDWAKRTGKHYQKYSISSHGNPFYDSWRGIMRRIKANTGNTYKSYKKRGITVCDRWKNFENFLEDMSPTYFKGAQIDRINNDGNYEPGNCRWATRKEQMNNTRHNVKLTFQGKTKNIIQWAEEIGLSAKIIQARIKRYHWSVEKTLTTPKQKNQFE